MILQLQRPELESYINEQVRVGNFPTPEAVIEDALARVMTEMPVELTEEDIAAIQESDSQMVRGEVMSADELKTQMRQAYRKGRA